MYSLLLATCLLNASTSQAVKISDVGVGAGNGRSTGIEGKGFGVDVVQPAMYGKEMKAMTESENKVN